MCIRDSSETDKCIDDGWYESPIYTVDTVSPIITEVFCNQYPVRKKEDRQYFKNAPEIIIRIQEENFNKANFSVDGKMFYADGKSMEKEWRTLKAVSYTHLDVYKRQNQYCSS